MIFDIRTKESAMNFLMNVIGFSNDEIDLAWEDSNKCFDSFWNIIESSIVEDEFEDLSIISFHIVGSLDECKEIKKYGLQNLQFVLSNNTIMRCLLLKCGISFELENRLMYSNGKIISIDLEELRQERFINENLFKIALRIFEDSRVNTFLYNENPEEYGEDVSRRPEFLKTLSDFDRKASLVEKYWKNHSKRYILTVKTGMKDVELSTFNLSDNCEKIDIIKELIHLAVERCFYPDEYRILYFKNNASIPPECIIELLSH